MYKAVIFDMDGTILDTLEDICASINAALQSEGYPARTIEEVRQMVGNGNRKLAERAVPAGAGADAAERVFRAFHAHYRVHAADHTKIYSGIEPLIAELRRRGMRTAVVSNKADYAVQALCRRYFPGLFDAAAGDRDGVRRKPYPDGVLAMLDVLGVSSGEAVYVGDSEVDVETARNAGLFCIAVTWGFRTKAFLLERGARCTADSAEELGRLLLANV